MDEHIPFDKPMARWCETDHFRAATYYAEYVLMNESAIDHIEDATADGDDTPPDALEFHRGLVHRYRWWAEYHLRAAEYLAQQ